MQDLGGAIKKPNAACRHSLARPEVQGLDVGGAHIGANHTPSRLASR